MEEVRRLRLRFPVVIDMVGISWAALVMMVVEPVKRRTGTLLIEAGTTDRKSVV